MKPITHPPDILLRAYGDLINQAFLFLRGYSHRTDFDRNELHDLGDAMHNVAGILMDYGKWTDDEKYREYYLRPFDEKWGEKSIRLEEFLDSRIRWHSGD